MTSPRRYVALALALGLLMGALAGAGAVLARGPASVAGPARPTEVIGAPTAGAAAGTSGISAAGTAIAYPVYPGYPGTPGVAPDHTIVVTGVGQADLAGDGSGRPEALKTALAAALADARGQADLIATTLGISITGVLSVNTSVGDYGPVPYAVPMTGGSTTPGAPLPGPVDPVSLPQLSVSVTVAFGVN
jgi:hypothetical protein